MRFGTNNRDNKKKEPWRIVVGILAIAGGILLLKWIINKTKK